MPEEFRLSDGTSSDPWDVGILISGCNVVCADGPELRSSASHWIMVRGPMVDDIAVPEEEIVKMIANKLSKMA